MIDMYLQSPAAAQTVARLLNGWAFDPPKPDAEEEALLAQFDLGERQDVDNPGRSLSAMGSTWGVNRDGAWARVTLTCIGMQDIFCAYYRPEGDRFIVGDLGEGQRSRCLRTGAWRVAEAGAPVDGVLLDAGGRVFGCTKSAVDDRHLLTVSAAYLPAAICRVMLASYQMANGAEK